MSTKSNHQSEITWAVVVAAVVAVIAVLSITVGAHEATGATRAQWYEVRLKTGETNGYKWVVGAKGPKHEPLNEICALASLTEPPQEGKPFVEGTEAVGCSSLATPIDSVAASPAFGSGDSRLVLLAVLYRPVVREVAFLLGTGERRVFRPRMATVLNRRAKGIPRFRYLAAPFEGETCIRKVTLFDRSGKVIDNEARPSCPDGGNL